ncbi:MAG: hypothetical protein ACLFVK_06645 [Dehalococcoidia bacterium]
MDEKLEQEIKDFLRNTSSGNTEGDHVYDLINRLTEEWSPYVSNLSRAEGEAIGFIMTVLVNRLPLSEVTGSLFELGRAFERLKQEGTGDDGC